MELFTILENSVNLFLDRAGTIDDLENSLNSVTELIVKIFGLLVPILGAIIVVFGLIKFISLTIKLQQYSDDPEGRKRIIKAMIWWGIGIFISLAATIVVPTVLFDMFGISFS